jgi:hypothetical protein
VEYRHRRLRFNFVLVYNVAKEYTIRRAVASSSSEMEAVVVVILVIVYPLDFGKVQ